jgi:cyanophycin synthetase
MESDNVVIRTMRALRGPNLYAYMPVLQVTLDIGPYEDRPSSSFPGLIERLTAWLPGLTEHECSLGRPCGFIERLRRGTYLAHIVEHIALELQSQMGFEVSYGRARGSGERGVYTLIVAYKEEEPARAAVETAVDLALAAMHDRAFDIEAELEYLNDVADRYRLGPSTAAIVAAARARDIPVVRLTPTSSLVQLGYGVHQKRIRASETTLTSAIAVDLCQDKSLTNRMLHTVGVPVPRGEVVRSADAAWSAAEAIGLPVVVKPEAGNQGKGVGVDLRTEADVRAAFELADEIGRGDVLVERHICGVDYRLLVVNGRMVAAARRDAAQVVGDGVHSVEQLVQVANRDPRRRHGHTGNMTRIRLDGSVDLVLSQQGLTLASIPEVGQTVKLRSNANLSTGGTATDVTDDVHPSNARLAELAAQILGMDVAGVDVVCTDIGRPLQEQGGAIVEVNAAPGLRMHLAPAFGSSRDVGRPIVELLYPDRTPARIPILAVTGTNGKTTVTRLIAHMYATARKLVGMTTTEGTYIGRERIIKGDCSGPQSARAVLLHPRVEVAVLETARGGILREGLAFDWCSVGVVTNISADHLGLKGINTVEELARVKQVVVENVHRSGAAVLNAEDRLTAEMAAACSGRVVYFALDADHHVMRSHLAQGGWGVFVQDGHIVMAQDGHRVELMPLESIPFTLEGRVRFQVQNALAATAAAWAQGLNPALIARALTTFRSDSATVPGRFNVNEMNGVQVVCDYGHNVAAMQALGDAVAALGDRRTVVLVGLPGDRRDADLAATVQALLPRANEFVFYDQTERRGRAPMEVPNLLANVVPDGIPRGCAPSQAAGVEQAWRRVRPGDRLVLIADEVDEALDLLYELVEADTQLAPCVSVSSTPGPVLHAAA